jgi:hypothetical protein
MGKWSDREEDKNTDFSLLEAGNYKGSITDIVCKEATSGFDYIQLEYTLENNRKVWDILSDSPSAHGVVRGKLGNLGFTSEEKDELPDSMEMLQVAIKEKVSGVKFNVNVGVQPAKGDYAEKNNVKYVKRLEAADMAL